LGQYSFTSFLNRPFVSRRFPALVTIFHALSNASRQFSLNQSWFVEPPWSAPPFHHIREAGTGNPVLVEFLSLTKSALWFLPLFFDFTQSPSTPSQRGGGEGVSKIAPAYLSMLDTIYCCRFGQRGRRSRGFRSSVQPRLEEFAVLAAARA